MRLLLQQVTKNGLGIAGLCGPKFTSRQYPYAFSQREELSTASRSSKYEGSGSVKNSPRSAEPVTSQGSATSGGSPSSGNRVLKLLLGSAAVVAAITTVFYAEWQGKIPTGGSKREQVFNNEIKQRDMKSSEFVHDGHLKDEDSAHSMEDLTNSNLSQDMEELIKEEMKQNDESHEVHLRQDELEGMQQEITTQESNGHKDHEVKGTVENVLHVNNDKQKVDSLNAIKDDTTSDDRISQHKSSSEEILQPKVSETSDVQEVDENTDGKEEVGAGGILNTGNNSEISSKPFHDIVASNASEQDDEPQDQRPRNTLADNCLLLMENKSNSEEFSNEENRDSNSVSEQKEDAKEGNGNINELDGMLVFNFLEAIHAAERRQAESDARIYDEYKRRLKEKYEKELKDTRARELMYAEEADSLEKELNKEKAKAAAALKLLHEKAEERLKSELQCKEEEAEMKLKKAQLLAKAETAAAIANAKSSHLNEMADANLQINSLRTAFYTRSEEARQSHSVHKLALGTFALEDALTKGVPLQMEIAVLRASMKGIDKDALLDVALSSLPLEALTHGTKTHAQLHQKFESLKGALRELSLVPSEGGGVLTHALAWFASAMKVKEDGLYSEGIESTIAHVEHCLAEGNLIEAANALEKVTQGSKAESLAIEWARQTRNRAVTEQALSLLQAYATAIASSLA